MPKVNEHEAIETRRCPEINADVVVQYDFIALNTVRKSEDGIKEYVDIQCSRKNQHGICDKTTDTCFYLQEFR